MITKGNIVGIDTKGLYETIIEDIELFEIAAINEDYSFKLLGIDYPLTTHNNCSFVKPIILTDKILTDWCKFIPTSFNCFMHEETGFEIMKLNNTYEFLSHDWSPKTKFLHEVQNLFEILTRKKLIIKPKK